MLTAPSLQGRLLAAYLAAWLGTAALAGGAVMLYLRGDPMRWADHSGAIFAIKLADSLGQGADGRLTVAPPPQAVRWLIEALPNDFGYRVFDTRGRVLLWSSTETETGWTAAGLMAEPREGPGRAEIGGQPVRLWTRPAELPEGRVWVQVGASERLIALVHSGTTLRLGGAMAVTAVVSILLLGVVQFFVLRQLMRPVRRLSREAADVAHQPGRRLDVADLPAELQPLVQTFNQSLDSVELGYERQVRFLADAAHELKTPLALLRAQVELGEKPTVLLEDIDHMTRQVHQLLLLAEVTELHSYRHEPLDVASVVDDVGRFLQPLATRHRVLLRTDTAQPPPGLQGDRDALFALVKNLAENAISCSPAGGTVRLSLSPSSLVVRDEGGGIAPAHFEHLFKRFWRAPSRRDRGAGLGLAICEAVSRAHGWRIAVRNAQPGAEFTLHFSAQAAYALGASG